MESHPLRGDIKPNPRIPRIPDEFCQPAWTTEIISIIFELSVDETSFIKISMQINDQRLDSTPGSAKEGGWYRRKTRVEWSPFEISPGSIDSLHYYFIIYSVLILLSIETIVIGSFYTSPWFQTHLSSNLLIATLCTPFYSRVWKRLWSIMGAQTCTIHVSARVPSILYNQI